jgi:hypothetical protein
VLVFVLVWLLQHRTRSLVDGYEYLQGLSTHLPDMFRETAAVHRKTLQDAIHLLTPEEQSRIAEQELVSYLAIGTPMMPTDCSFQFPRYLLSIQVLAKVRSELQSISHERVIMDVLMRPAITETKRLYASHQADNQKVLKKRYSRTVTDSLIRPGTTEAIRSAENNAPAPRTAVPVSYTRSFSTAAQPSQGIRGVAAKVADAVTFHDAAELLSTPIHIPQYDPSKVPATSAPSSSGAAPQRSRSARSGGQQGLGGYLNFAYDYENREGLSGNSSRLIARAVGGALMVRFFCMRAVQNVVDERSFTVRTGYTEHACAFSMRQIHFI